MGSLIEKRRKRVRKKKHRKLLKRQRVQRRGQEVSGSPPTIEPSGHSNVRGPTPELGHLRHGGGLLPCGHGPIVTLSPLRVGDH